MPTGRPDYWYGTALYFENNPSDGETARGPTSNWAYDHTADPEAHHGPVEGIEATRQVEVGSTVDVDGMCEINLYTQDPATKLVSIRRDTYGNESFRIISYSTGNILFYCNGAYRFEIRSAGGVDSIWDDTPTNGELYKGVTSDWAFDHKADAAAHHSKYLDAEAVTAMGAKGDANALHHDRYDDAEAVSAMGAKGAGNPLHHDIYTDAEAEAACEAIVDDTAVNGATDQPISSNWAFDHNANGSAHHAPGWIWNERGDPASADRAVAGWTKDATWRDWDISGIVGSAAVLVGIRVLVQNDTAGEFFTMRENGNSNDFNIGQVYCQVAGMPHAKDFLIMTDANGVVEYYAQNLGNWLILNCTVFGWFAVST